MKILFAGTPEYAVPALKNLAGKYDVCGVLTNPPTPKGRSKKLIDSEVATVAKKLKMEGILKDSTPILTPTKLDSFFREEVKKIKPDILICFAYGKFFGKKTMELFTLGGINIHPSLLPKWRGCAPVPYSILAGESVTGITIQTISEKMDEGNILSQKQIQINNEATSETLLTLCSTECIDILFDVLDNYKEKLKNAIPQNPEQATYSKMLEKQDGIIDWSKSAKEIDQKIRAFTPWPGCFSYKDDEKINIINAKKYDTKIDDKTKNTKYGTILGTDKNLGILVQTGEGILAVSVLQKQSKKKLFWKDFLNGSPNFTTGQFKNEYKGGE